MPCDTLSMRSFLFRTSACEDARGDVGVDEMGDGCGGEKGALSCLERI